MIKKRTRYKNRKNNLVYHISKFIQDDNLFHLVEAEIIIGGILRENRFPKSEYKKWLKKQV